MSATVSSNGFLLLLIAVIVLAAGILPKAGGMKRACEKARTGGLALSPDESEGLVLVGGKEPEEEDVVHRLKKCQT